MGVNGEKEFTKYQTRGPYHWKVLGINPLRRNASGLARYKNMVQLAKTAGGSNLKSKHILELGCGDGVLSNLLADLGAEVTGIDNSTEAIKLATLKSKKGLKINFLVGDACDLPFPSNYFDYIVSTEVIEHVSNAQKFLEEAKRVLKTGGAIIVSTPVRFTKKPIDVMHFQEWFPEDYCQLIMNYFPSPNFFYSHPMVWKEIYKIRVFTIPIFTIAINCFSYIWNPFEVLSKNCNSMHLQYCLAYK